MLTYHFELKSLCDFAGKSFFAKVYRPVVLRLEFFLCVFVTLREKVSLPKFEDL